MTTLSTRVGAIALPVGVGFAAVALSIGVMSQVAGVGGWDAWLAYAAVGVLVAVIGVVLVVVTPGGGRAGDPVEGRQ